MSKSLHTILNANGQDFYQSLVPSSVVSNLKQSFAIRPYQQSALGRFIFYYEAYPNRPKGVPTQLLYHMATGSGKTLIMAGLILYLYKMGYRHFLFFVNSTNIIEKTRDNFLNRLSSKYLFAETISFADKQVRICEVDHFQHSNPDDISIAFNTVQGLHSSLNAPRENSLTYGDFESGKLVLISDEAHHINAETKKGQAPSSEDIKNRTSWEATITHIFNAHPDNMMLEFTATVDLENPDIAAKYRDKLLFDYPLREFRADGYSKGVQTLQADLPPFERAVQAILLSQFRRKLFEKNGLVIKPIVLFKSKTIKESQRFQAAFTNSLKTLSVETLLHIRSVNANTVLYKVFDYCQANSIPLDNLIEELKGDFNEDKQISVNSKEESEAKQIAINSLEDENNPYRVIFAVDKLNEGWDVLNLFDIVRLYDTRGAQRTALGKTTMQEAQLIGRGARYCPFQLPGGESPFMRKYDHDEAHELRICEELYYHASYNPSYIRELNSALVQIGIRAPQNIRRELKVKDSFAQSAFYRSGFLFKNELKRYSRKDIFALNGSIIQQQYHVTLPTGTVRAQQMFQGSAATEDIQNKNREYRLLDFGERIIRKAINKLDFYRFDNLQTHLPNLNSISEFINSERYLGKITLQVASAVTALSPFQKLAVAIEVLERISTAMESAKIEFKGSTEFKPYLIRDIITDKQLTFSLDEEATADRERGRSMCNPTETQIYLDLAARNWYAQSDCFGGTEEKYLITYIDSIYDSLKELYDEIYLVKNERYLKIYAFEDGRPFEPDFMLFLLRKQAGITYQYQIFIESKAAHVAKQNKWEEELLLQLKEMAQIAPMGPDSKYGICGLPLFTHGLSEQEHKFKTACAQLTMLP